MPWRLKAPEREEDADGGQGSDYDRAHPVRRLVPQQVCNPAANHATEKTRHQCARPLSRIARGTAPEYSEHSQHAGSQTNDKPEDEVNPANEPAP